jgi:hypothetical protein
MRVPDKAQRGLGPFTGRQLTVIIVSVASAIVLAPAAVGAAVGAFTNNSATVPAVKGVNSNAHGIGVQGNGKKYGVFSNGPLGVAPGKPLSCVSCVGGGALAPGSVTASKLGAGSVGVTALSAAAKQTQPLAAGESESGHFALGGGSSTSGQAGIPITYTRPLAAPITNIINASESPSAHCPGVGSADPDYLCLYENQTHLISGMTSGDSNTTGAEAFWTITGASSYVEGNYTVTAP